MINTKRQLIDEQTSPLHRIIWLSNPEEPLKGTFENNISAFHIGNGYFLSVAHNLRTQAGIFTSIDEDIYRKELLYKLDGAQKLVFDQHYFTDTYAHKLYLNNADAASVQTISNILKQKRFDTRWVTYTKKKISTPHLVIQFRTNSFYKLHDLDAHFRPNQCFYEEALKKYTFLLEVELVDAFYAEDIALYKIVNAPAEVISAIPYIDINTDLIEDDPTGMHCLQSAPANEVGRLLNDAHIEGLMDHFGIFADEIGGNYIFDGYRYLVKGYFRFGSSGAPYVAFDPLRGRYVANAIQSEACGLQLTINNEKNGNYQYVNAIASPLYLIKEQLRALNLGDGSGFEYVF